MQDILSSVRLLMAVLMLVAITGCGDSDDAADRGVDGDSDTAAAPGRSGAGRVYTIGVSQCALEQTWQKQMKSDIQAAVKGHPKLKVTFKNAQGNTPAQRSHLTAFVAPVSGGCGVDLIIIDPNEPVPLTEPVAKVVNSGVPVIVLRRPLIGDQYTCCIRADEEKIGTAAGEWLARKLGGRGKIVELKGAYGSRQAEDRHRGFRAALKDYPDIRILLETHVDWAEAKARKEMESALARFDEIDAVYAHNDRGAHGAYLAARAVGREKEIIFVGIDALPHEGVAYVKKGALTASFEYSTGGAKAIDVALKILAGEEVPKNIELGSRVFTPENVDRGGEPID